MITEKDLQEAIAECEGQRNPNANTCIKLAAFYTIRQHMFGQPEPSGTYSYAAEPPESVVEPDTISYESDTEFSQAIYGMHTDDVISLMDELMSALQVVQPRLYDSVMRKLNQ